MPRVNGTEMFTRYSDISTELTELLMRDEFAPEIEKTLKTWNMAEVANLMKVSPSFLRQLITQGKIPEGRVESKSRRTFTLSEIHKIRSALCALNPKHDRLKPYRDAKLSAVIGITNFKGGVGKSTTTVTLAHDLCLRGYRVLVGDLDGQGSATTLFGYIPNENIAPEETIEPFLERRHPANRFDFKPNDLGYAIVETHWEGLDLIPANLTVNYADIALAGVNQEGYRYWEQLKLGIDTVRANYDVILLDFPPSLGYLAINAIYACDGLIVPIPPDMLDFTSSSAFFAQLAEVSETLESHTGQALDFDFVKILMTKCETRLDDDSKESLSELLQDRRQREAKRMRAYLMSSFKDGLLQNEILKSDAIKEAARKFKSVLELEAGKTDCSRSTLKRCTDQISMAHDEIEALILAAFDRRLKHGHTPEHHSVVA